MAEICHIAEINNWDDTPITFNASAAGARAVRNLGSSLASNNMRKRTLRSLAEVYQVATINPWSDTAITFNASDEPKF